MVPILTIKRYATAWGGTFARAAATNAAGATVWQGYTLEEQWVNNQRDISCIPAGRYRAKFRTPENTPTTVRKMYVYELLDVPNRSGILIHAGKASGDQAATEEWLKGCIAPGTMVGTHVVGTDEETGAHNVTKPAVVGTMDALEGFHRAVGRAAEILVVIDWEDGVGERAA